MNKPVKVLLIIILFLSFGYWAINLKSAPTIQNDIQQRIEKSLQDSDHDSINAEVKGRDVILSGSVDDEKLRSVVEKMANIDGVHFIENRITIDSTSKLTDYYLEVYKNHDSIDVKGYVSDAISRHHFINYIMENFTTTLINDQLTERPRPPKNWIVTIKSGLKALQKVETGRLKITSTQLSLTGKVSSLEIQKQIITNLNMKFSKKIRITTRLDIIDSTTGIEPLNKTDQRPYLNKTTHKESKR